MNQWPQMSWFDPLRLYWLALVPIVILILAFASMRFGRRLAVAQVSLGTAVGQWSMAKTLTWLKTGLFALALTCLIVASAGPRLGWTWIESRQSGLDMVVAVDVSRSMMAKDLDPSRLERARRMVIDLLAVAPGDRIGLVVFAGAAFVQCPLTVDHGALRSFLDQLSTEMIPVGGTDISGALRESLRALEAGGEDQGLGKLIILMTDGEDHQGDLDAAISEVVKSKAKVVTVGMASESGAPIPDPQGGFIKDRQGNVVLSRLAEEPLKLVASKTGGQYINASDAQVSVASVYQDVIRAKGTVRETQARKERLWYERFQWVAGLALILILIEMLVTEVKIKTVAKLGLVMWFSFSGNDSYAGTSERARYNQAVEALTAGDTAKAQQEFQQLVKSASGEEQRRSLYNLGNILAAAGQLEEAVKLYEAALSMDYQDIQVRENLAWARRKSQSQQKQKQDQNQQNKDQKKQDQQKQDQNQQQQNQDQKDGQSGDQKPENQDQNQAKQDQKDKNNDTEKPDQKSAEDKKSKDQKQANEKADGKQAKEELSDQKEQNQAAQQGVQPMTPEEAEKLLRAAPDDRKSMVPVFRGQKTPPRRVDKDW